MIKKRISTDGGRQVNVPWPKIFLGIALVSTIGGALLATKTLSNIDKNIAAIREAARPAKVKLTKITAPNCVDCFNVDGAVETLKKQNVLIGEEKTLVYDSSEAQSLIRQHEIKKIPMYLLTGEITKTSFEGFVNDNGQLKNDTFVLTKVTPVFIDPETKKEMGRISVTYLVDSSCVGCYDPVKIQKPILLQGYGVKLQDERMIEIASEEGKGLVAQYKIIKVPTILLSPDADQHDRLKNVWKSVGTVESDGWYVFREMQQLGGITYKDLSTRQVIKPTVPTSGQP